MIKKYLLLPILILLSLAGYSQQGSYQIGRQIFFSGKLIIIDTVYALPFSPTDTLATRAYARANGAGGGGGGAVASVFGRTGVVIPATNDYTWAQINKTTSSLADITTRLFSDLQSKPTTISGYAITDAVSTSRNLSVGFGLLGGGTLAADRSFAVDSQSVSTRNRLNSVTDSLVSLISASGGGTVFSVSRTNGFGISASVANATTNPNITIATDTTSSGLSSYYVRRKDSLVGGGYVSGSRTINGKTLLSNITLQLASSDFANQGTTTTVLHGNASGNPSFGQVSNSDLAGSIAASKLIGTDITQVGTLVAGATGTGFTVNFTNSTITGILGANNGGTANGFTAFTGPTTSTKTFTLPNASSTILTSNAAVTVAQGGTGVASVTAYSVLLGGTTSTGAFQNVSGLGTSGQVLTSAGAGAPPAWSNAGAGTVASVGTINSQTKSANGLVITGTSIVAQTVDGSTPGLMASADYSRLYSNTYYRNVIDQDSSFYQRLPDDSTIYSVIFRPTAGSSKISITRTKYADSVILYAVDVVEANLTLSNLGGTLSIAKGGSGQTTANAALNAFLPSQTGNSGKFLTTDGSNTSWATGSGGLADAPSILAMQALGSNTKALTMGISNPIDASSDGSLTSQQVRYVTVYLAKAATLTGIQFFSTVAGNFTASNTNGVALYTMSGGTWTKVAESTNDATGAIWKNTAGTTVSVAFSSTYSASVGAYVVALLYCSSAQSIAPKIAAKAATASNSLSTWNYTNSSAVIALNSPATTFSSTVTASGLSPSGINLLVGVY
jgi:hypothetical protein